MLSLRHFVEHQQESAYLTLPFTMPPDTEALTLAYRYDRHHESAAGVDGCIARQEINNIDLGLIAPDGIQVEASVSLRSRDEGPRCAYGISNLICVGRTIPSLRGDRLGRTN